MKAMCGICNGSGFIGPDGDMVTEQPCGQCGGTGCLFVVPYVSAQRDKAAMAEAIANAVCAELLISKHEAKYAAVLNAVRDVIEDSK